MPKRLITFTRSFLFVSFHGNHTSISIYSYNRTVGVMERDVERKTSSSPVHDSSKVPVSYGTPQKNRRSSGNGEKVSEEGFSLMKNLTPVLLRKKRDSITDKQKVRKSMEAPVFRQPYFAMDQADEEEKQRSLSVDDDDEKEIRQFDKTILHQVTRYRLLRSGNAYSRSTKLQDDDNLSLNSDGRVSDGFSPIGEDLEGSGQFSSRYQNRPMPAQVGSLNVREMASFLEKTDSFIRRIDTGGDSGSHSKLVNEVSSMPFKSRQIPDRGSCSSAFSTEIMGSHCGSFHGDDTMLRMEQSVELQRENFRLKGRLMELQQRLEKSEKENIRLREKIKRLQCADPTEESENSGGDCWNSSLQTFEYSQKNLTELLQCMGFEESIIKQVGVQIELEYQR